MSGKQQAAVPLQSAVLCVDCECITAASGTVCAVCGSHSLLNLARLVNGRATAPTARERPVAPLLFDVQIAVELRQAQPSEMSNIVDEIVGQIEPWLNEGQGVCHVEMQPAAASAELLKRAA
jgi:hypothetical protein